MSVRDKRKKNQQKWPVEYRLEYKRPRDSISSHKYCSALDDDQALVIFNEMFTHLDITDHTIIVVERYDRFGDKWDTVNIVQ